MAILLNPEDDTCQIALEGALDIGAAAELKAALMEALGRGRPVRVSLEALTDLDITTFQLLWTARRDAEAAGVPLTLVGPLQDSVRQTLADLGLCEVLIRE